MEVPYFVKPNYLIIAYLLELISFFLLEIENPPYKKQIHSNINPEKYAPIPLNQKQ